MNTLARAKSLFAVFANHALDARYNRIGNVCDTVTQYYGTGGGNAPIVVEMSKTFCAGHDYFMIDGAENIATCIESSDYKDPPILCVEDDSRAGGCELMQRKYIVRRLMPIECARLQGFPTYWGYTPAVSEQEMSDEDVIFWNEVRKTKASVEGKSYKKMTKAQAVKYLNSLHTDAAEYKMWGNGMCLNNAEFVIRRIKELDEGTLNKDL